MRLRPPWIRTPESLREFLERRRLELAAYSTGLLAVSLLSKGFSFGGMFFLLILFVSLWIALRVVSELAWDSSYKKTSRWLKFSARPDAVLLTAAVIACALIYFHVLTGMRLYLAALNNEIGYAGLGIIVAVIPIYLMIAFAAMLVLYLPLLVIIEAVFRLMPNSNSSRPPSAAAE